MNTKLYKILFEETVIELDPETSDLFDRLDSHTDELEDELQKESLFEMIYEDVEISGDQLPDGEVVVVDPSFSPESLKGFIRLLYTEVNSPSKSTARVCGPLLKVSGLGSCVTTSRLISSGTPSSFESSVTEKLNSS